MRRATLTAVGLAALMAGAGACSSSGHASTPINANPNTLLSKAKAKLDSTQSVHFTLDGENVSNRGTNLSGGSGDIARPDLLQGSFTVLVNGFEANVGVASKGGVFEAKLPFSKHYAVTKPSSFGLSDPSTLLDPNHGLSSLLSNASGPKVTRQERLSGELLDEVSFTVPGSTVPVLPDLKPSRPVGLVAAIDPSTYEVRQMVMTGPFTSASSNTTYTVTLTKYGEPVTVNLPPTS
ncbi:MAG: LppX_LprAFG lipoprotein [Acidimicrobiales bacterium]